MASLRTKIMQHGWKVSEDGKHAWLIGGGGKEFVGLHVDEFGAWLDLRVADARGIPEFAVVVPRDGGNARLQLADKDGKAITLDLVKAAKLINEMLPE